jgi:hypothetical protein
MKVYWSYEQNPEIAKLSRTEREAVMKRINALALKHWEWWVAFRLMLVVVGVGAYLGGKAMSGVIRAGIGGGWAHFSLCRQSSTSGRNITQTS